MLKIKYSFLSLLDFTGDLLPRKVKDFQDFSDIDKVRSNASSLNGGQCGEHSL